NVTVVIDGAPELVFQRATNVPNPDHPTDPHTVGAHGFAFVLPAKFFDGRAHSVVAIGTNGAAFTALTNSGRAFTLSTNPTVGQVDGVSGTGRVEGWSFDPSAGSAAEF